LHHRTSKAMWVTSVSKICAMPRRNYAADRPGTRGE
jgi:hypothetical protein